MNWVVAGFLPCRIFSQCSAKSPCYQPYLAFLWQLLPWSLRRDPCSISLLVLSARLKVMYPVVRIAAIARVQQEIPNLCCYHVAVAAMKR
ncbi:hypothetical protein ARMGADRAFT_306451 [Armillaria gallica]|uniref:Secreted protein n=1 Tax=Armillaria gallica TaxID=47427 RepID=A0A2H3DRU8_ARMGA|nr:hypothetical protein ARMGADRAFT_306451 [Armillaria gallica]